MGLIPYETTQEDINELLLIESPGKILQFIRKKAEKMNPGQFTINSLAGKVGVSSSMISRYESGEQRELKATALVKISQVMSVPLEALQYEYYRNNPRTFTICGVTNSIINFDLLNPDHRIKIVMQAFSPAGVMYQHMEDVVELSVLEYEEFISEVQGLVDKVKRRRQTWRIKEQAFEALNSKGEDND